MKFAVYLTIGLFAFSGVMLIEKLGKSYYQERTAGLQSGGQGEQKQTKSIGSEAMADKRARELRDKRQEAKPVRTVKVTRTTKGSRLKGKRLSNVRVEEDSIIGSLENPEAVIVELVTLIRATGYRCDSVSAVSRHTFSRGFSITCNSFAYKFEVNDRGGRWQVSLK